MKTFQSDYKLYLKMSQSEAHLELVRQVAVQIERRYPGASIVADIQHNPGDPIPPMIGGFRPDVYATLQNSSPFIIIAEAKTDADLYVSHTNQQVSAFIDHIEHGCGGMFILATFGQSADHAKTILRFTWQASRISNATLVVFDSCDFWKLDSQTGIVWHLI